MSYAVTYYCPHCGTLVSVQREGYLNDKSVTPYPLEGWEYAQPSEKFGEAADGVRFVCGEHGPSVTWKATPDVPADVNLPADAVPDGADDETAPGCGEPFYLSFVRFERGQEIDGETISERVRLGESHGPPSGPSGPQPDTDSGGFY